MSKTLVNKTSLPITATDAGQNIVIGPGNSVTFRHDGDAVRFLANASIANFREAETRDGFQTPTT